MGRSLLWTARRNVAAVPDWGPLTSVQVRMYSRTVAIIGGFLVLASGAGELYRRKPRSRSLQSTGQVFLGIYLICVVGWGAVGWKCLLGNEV